jgi:hypothetical protein
MKCRCRPVNLWNSSDLNAKTEVSICRIKVVELSIVKLPVRYNGKKWILADNFRRSRVFWKAAVYSSNAAAAATATAAVIPVRCLSQRRLVTSLLLCEASIDQKCVSGIVSQMTITDSTETIAFTVKTFRERLYKATIAESNGNVRLEIKVANSVHWTCYGKAANIIVKNFSV